MSAPPSRILKLLRENQLPTVLKVNLSEPRVIEIAGLCGVDAVWLCNEHVPNDWIGLENQIRAARVHHIDALVRVGRGSYSDYIRPFEAGAQGIIVPHVANRAEARQIVDWVRFHPVGKRALDGGNIDGEFCLTPMDEYIRHSNTERIVILQIESPEALENVDEICSVPGFDGILFGPGDFSHRIGKAGQIDAPEVVAARKRVGAATLKHGKFAMTAGLIAPLAQLVEEGYRVINIGADVVALTGYVKQRLDLVRGLINDLPDAVRPPVRSPTPEVTAMPTNVCPRLDHQVAIVSGGASGFGQESCRTFADEGAKIVRFIASISLGQAGRATDIASTAVLFAHSASAFITGFCLDVDGGRCI